MTGHTPSMALLVETYIRGRVRRGELTPLTGKTQRSALGPFAKLYGQREVAKLSRRHIERWQETTSHMKPSTRRQMHSTMRCFTGWLVREGHILRDPMREIRPPKQPRSVPRAMPADDVGKLLRACPDSRARAIVALMVGCGLRCIEVARLKVEDWDRSAGLIRVTGKGSHERLLPIPPMVQRHLQNYLVEHPAGTGPLIRSESQPWKPIQPGTISKMVGAWMNEAGVKGHRFDGVSAHALRHTAASDVLDNCGDIRIVQELLGHAHLATTAIYLRRANLLQMRDAMGGRDYT